MTASAAAVGGATTTQPAAGAAPSTTAPAAAGVSPDEVVALLDKLGDLKAKGVLTDEEFSAKKAELLKKLV